MNKKIRLIETFAGYGSQAMALKNLNIDFEHYKISEWNILANKSYNAIHKPSNKKYDIHLNDDEIFNKLEELQISLDDKKCLNKNDFKRKGIDWCRQVYNEFEQNNNLGSITHIYAKDLQICDLDKYLYLFTYSFPCTDLSSAGKQKGMNKGSGTSSGLLWELERILNECENLPQVLFMENVKQVLSKKNKDDFDNWCKFLESKGYTNSYKVLNSCDYGIPQNRERCYMISILGNQKYEFPNTIPLTKYLRDYLDDKVDDNLYIHNIYANEVKEIYKNFDFINDKNRYNKICVLGHYMKSKHESSRIVNINGISPTIKENHDTVTAIIDKDNNVRKLSVYEFGKLMGVSNNDIDKILQVQSIAKARKQFGNSIVVNVMECIFDNLFKTISL